MPFFFLHQNWDQTMLHELESATTWEDVPEALFKKLLQLEGDEWVRSTAFHTKTFGELVQDVFEGELRTINLSDKILARMKELEEADKKSVTEKELEQYRELEKKYGKCTK